MREDARSDVFDYIEMFYNVKRRHGFNNQLSPSAGVASSRESAYCSGMYQELHTKQGIRCSMMDGYDCYQNALAERVNGILKTELLLQRPQDLTQARKMVSESVSIYNHERPHLSLKYKTPDAMHRALE